MDRRIASEALGAFADDNGRSPIPQAEIDAQPTPALRLSTRRRTTDAVLTEDPGAVARLQMACRAEGVFVRPLGRGVAVSPPLICGQDEIDLIGAALGAGLDALATAGARAT